MGDVLAEIDQKELGDEVAFATAELARLREEDARMTQLDQDEARSKAEAERQLERALRRSLELDRSRLATHQRIVAGDQSLKARRMVSDSDALKSQAERRRGREPRSPPTKRGCTRSPTTGCATRPPAAAPA